MKTQLEKVLKSLERLGETAKQASNTNTNDVEKALKLISVIAKAGLGNHLSMLDQEGIEQIFANHPYLLIEYMSNILNLWTEYSNWYHNNEEALKAASEYASEYFKTEFDKFTLTIKVVEDNQREADQLQEQIANLDAQMSIYATPGKIEELIGEKETKTALLKKLENYKKELESGLFEELDEEIKGLSEEYGEKGQALEELKAQKEELSKKIDQLENKLERTANHAKLLGEAIEVLDKAEQEIQDFNRTIAKENDIELRKLYVQLREDIEIGDNQGHQNITEELKAMKRRIDELEKVFGETLGKK